MFHTFSINDLTAFLCIAAIITPVIVDDVLAIKRYYREAADNRKIARDSARIDKLFRQ